MNSISNNQYFIVIKKENFLFQAIDLDNNKILTKKFLNNEFKNNDILNLVQNFLDSNIIELEKSLKDFIKEINIIIESDIFFTAKTSIKYKLKTTNTKLNNINEALLEIRNQFKKYSPKDEIIHMVINKYSLDGNDYSYLPENINDENLVIQVDFICLKNLFLDNLKKTISKYQISLNKILSYNFLNEINPDPDNDIFKSAQRSMNGLNQNEVLITNKPQKNLGFFEKFFNFFR
tara:strand:+ start:3143 stop:3844 length:702 start_codon:yes stop_codon:yes gene_type:complete